MTSVKHIDCTAPAQDTLGKANLRILIGNILVVTSYADPKTVTQKHSAKTYFLLEKKVQSLGYVEICR